MTRQRIDLRLPVLVTLVFLAGCGEPIPPNVDDWLLQENGNMSVRVPQKPKKESHSINHPAIGRIDFDIYVSSFSRTSGFMFMQQKYPIPPSQYDAAMGLEGAVSGMASESGGTIVDSFSIDNQPIPGKEALMSANKENLWVRARLYIDGDGPTLYQFQVIGPKDFVEGKAANDFFDSAKITPINKAAVQGVLKEKPFEE